MDTTKLTPLAARLIAAKHGKQDKAKPTPKRRFSRAEKRAFKAKCELEDDMALAKAPRFGGTSRHDAKRGRQLGRFHSDKGFVDFRGAERLFVGGKTSKTWVKKGH